MSTTSPKKYITVTEAAARLGVHRRTVQQWVRSGRLAGHRTPGGHWRVDVASLDELPMTPREVARLTGFSYQTVLRWAASGRINSERNGERGEYLIPASEVDVIGRRDQRSAPQEATP